MSFHDQSQQVNHNTTEAITPLEKDSPFSSNDEMPTRTTKLVFKMKTVDPKDKNLEREVIFCASTYK